MRNTANVRVACKIERSVTSAVEIKKYSKSTLLNQLQITNI